MESLAGAAHVLNDDTDVLRWGETEQKSHVDQARNVSLNELSTLQMRCTVGSASFSGDQIWVSPDFFFLNIQMLSFVELILR